MIFFRDTIGLYRILAGNSNGNEMYFEACNETWFKIDARERPKAQVTPLHGPFRIPLRITQIECPQGFDI